MRNQQTLDAFIDIYFRSIELDHTRASAEEKAKVNTIMIQREEALGITSEQLGTLLDLIDEYARDETKYNALLDLYLRQ